MTSHLSLFLLFVYCLTFLPPHPNICTHTCTLTPKHLHTLALVWSCVFICFPVRSLYRVLHTFFFIFSLSRHYDDRFMVYHIQYLGGSFRAQKFCEAVSKPYCEYKHALAAQQCEVIVALSAHFHKTHLKGCLTAFVAHCQCASTWPAESLKRAFFGAVKYIYKCTLQYRWRHRARFL